MATLLIIPAIIPITYGTESQLRIANIVSVGQGVGGHKIAFPKERKKCQVKRTIHVIL